MKIYPKLYFWDIERDLMGENSSEELKTKNIYFGNLSFICNENQIEYIKTG